MLKITNTVIIEEDELEESFIRSSGPGGQNVNKVETAVQIRFDARHSKSIPTSIYSQLKTLSGQRMTKDGVIIITANEFRSQDRNRKAAVERLVDLIRQATFVPKKRKPTKPTYGSKLRRLDKKLRRGNIKKGRGKVGLD